MRQVKKTAACILAVIMMVPGPAIAAPDNYEIDLKELRYGGAKTKPQQQPSSPSTEEIDLKELRRIAPPHPAKLPGRTPRRQTLPSPESAHSTSSEHESIHLVRPGEHLFKILIQRYGLTDPAAERLIPEVMRLNNITSPRGLKVGQRLRIPLPARNGDDGVPPLAAATKPRQKTPVVAPAPTPVLPKDAAPPAEIGSINIIATAPCELAHTLSEKMGVLAPSRIKGEKIFRAAYGGRGVTVACNLSPAELYTYNRLLPRGNEQLLAFDGSESAHRVVEQLANGMELAFQKHDPDSRTLPLTYIFAPFGAWPREVQVTILPDLTTGSPPVHSKPEK